MSKEKRKYHFVYKTTDTRNGNFYIGIHSTYNLNDGYIGSGKRIRNIKYRYGKDILKCEILEYLPDRQTLKKREEEIVNSKLLEEKKCMNLRIGGEGGFSLETQRRNAPKGAKKYIELMKDEDWNKIQRKKISKGLKRHLKENNKKGMWEGKKHSEETKNKMRKPKNVGKANPQFGTMWITNGVINKKIKKEEQIPVGFYKGRYYDIRS